MRPEIVSTARPSALRLASFLLLTLGSLLVALGSIGTWAIVRPFEETPTNGVDVWEGRVTFVAGVATLIVMLAMRLAATRQARRWLAVATIVLGAVAAGLAAWDAATADERFTAADQRDRIARSLSGRLGVPYETVRQQIEQAFDAEFPVDPQPGLWLVFAGGLVTAAGGTVSLAWATRTPARADLEAAPAEPTESATA